MAAMRAEAVALAEAEARAAGLAVTFATQDDFSATVNDGAAVARVRRALDALGVLHDEGALPMRGSEDFGRFGVKGCKAAMLFLGVGVGHASLHNPDYDFPDALTAQGVAVFYRLMRDILG
jgi:metal-dependent amidase/aminoacylase/carboxypeptidase family protein